VGSLPSDRLENSTNIDTNNNKHTLPATHVIGDDVVDAGGNTLLLSNEFVSKSANGFNNSGFQHVVSSGSNTQSLYKPKRRNITGKTLNKIILDVIS